MIVEEQKEQYEEEGQTKERIVYIKHYYDTNDEILSKYKGNKECKVFIQIGLALPKNNASVMMYDNLVINCSRNFTQEELDFAEIADKCPWLENKLIDFSYFLNQKLLTTNEYAELMDNFINKLRKINGRLLMYSQSYYSALKLKVDQIAQLQNRVDAVCASYQSDVVDSFKNTGGVLSLDLFNKNYAAMEVGISESNKISVVGLDKTLVSYANKYLKAQQRFLKNMYEFRKYFESPCGWADAKLYKDTIVLDPPERKENEKERFYLSFSPSS